MENKELISKAIEAFKVRYGKTPEEAGFNAMTVHYKEVIFSPTEKEVQAFIKNQKNIHKYFFQCGIFCAGLAIYVFIGLICSVFNPNALIGFCIIGMIFSVLFLIGIIGKGYRFKKIERTYKDEKLVFYGEDGIFVPKF